MRKHSSLIFILALITLSLSTHAAPTYELISGGGSCALTDVTAENISSVQCLDYSGNQDGGGYNQSINTDFELSPTIDWDGILYSESGDFSVSEQDSTWTYNGTLSAPFVIVLKASNAFTAYLFDAPDVANDGTYNVSITNKKGIAQELSHMTIYTTSQGQTTGIDIYGDPIPAVPLPAALWLFAPALLGFMGFRRKNKG